MSKPSDNKGLQFAHEIERIVLWAVLVLLLAVTALSTVQLAIDVINVALTSDGLVFLHGEELFKIFEAFFLVLIAVELLETVHIYLQDNVIHVEIVILVAITAVARKVIVLNLEKYEPVAVIGLAALAIALAGAYYLVRRAMRECDLGA